MTERGESRTTTDALLVRDCAPPSTPPLASSCFPKTRSREYALLLMVGWLQTAGTVDVETRYHPNSEYTWAAATCGACTWRAEGDEDDVRDKASAHTDRIRDQLAEQQLRVRELQRSLANALSED